MNRLLELILIASTISFILVTLHYFEFYIAAIVTAYFLGAINAFYKASKVWGPEEK